jgi:lipopolysaccharide export system permease protein
MPPASEVRPRRQGAAAAALARLRAVPWLTAGAFAAGLAVFAVLFWRGCQSAVSAGGSPFPLEDTVRDPARRTVWLEFVRYHWGAGTLCLLPAVVLTVLRLRGRALQLPTAIASVWILLYWTSTDILQHYHRTLDDPLGMEPSPIAYWWKVGLMAAFFLSIPVMLWLYWRGTLLDRYLLRNFFPPFLLCAGGLTGIMISMDLLNNMAHYAEHHMGPLDLGVYYLRQMPAILVLIVEACLLLATLFSLGKMSRHNETTAIVTSGRSVFRMLLPLLIFGLWCALGLMALNYHLAPDALMAKEKLQESKRGSGEVTAVTSIIYRNRTGYRSWTIHRVPYDLRAGNEMEEVMVLQQDEDDELSAAHFARRALWIPETGEWRLYDVTTFAPDTAGKLQRSETGLLSRSRSEWPETPGGMLQDKLDAEYLGVPSLLSCLSTGSTLPPRVQARYETTVHWRFALPFRAFLMVLLAAPLGIVASRRNMLAGVSTAFGIYIVVFFSGTLALKAGEGGYVPPVLAAWVVNTAFAVTGIALFIHRSHNRPSRTWRQRLLPRSA